MFLFSLSVGFSIAEDKDSNDGAYFVLTHTITDTDMYASEYVPLVLPFIGKYGAR